DSLSIVWEGVSSAASEEVVFAALTFVFMGYVLGVLGLMQRQVAILNSAFGRFRGGAGYVDSVASALFGSVSGSGSGNTAAVGSITIPWMTRSNWNPVLASTLVAGNAGLGISFPPSSSMFLLLGSAAVAPYVSADTLFIGLLCGGLWTLLYRLIVVFIWVRKFGISRVSQDDIQPFSSAFKQGWTALLIYLGIAIPLLLTVGPGADWSATRLGEDGADAISIIVWIPVLVLIAALVIGWKQVPRTARGWNDLLAKVAPQYAVVGATLFFAFAAAESLGALGLSDDLTHIMEGLQAPAVVMALLVGILILVIAAPLTATATIAAVGGVAFTALTSAGIAPLAAAVAILVFASTEGASPPGAAPIYIATGIARVDPGKTFVRLILWFVIPTLIIGTLIAIGLLPVIEL
ncbi:TRAP transporter permease, partial [Brevibacterium luteolum]|uniref:TRAP transporter permease n=1 Tax=Brevibacterium luteolum TaxID=199591 RepID=UPI00223C4A4E